MLAEHELTPNTAQRLVERVSVHPRQELRDCFSDIVRIREVRAWLT
jgi:hypothetical protein